MDQPISPRNDSDSRSATILIVDDAPSNLAVLSDLLHDTYRVRVANSGERALRAARSVPHPDLILLDIMMPEMDGFEVLQQLRADPATADIPVIFVTAIQDDQSEEQGFELGAADYIHKPIRPAVVLSRVRAQLQAQAARNMLKKNNERLLTKVEEGTHALEQAQMLLMQSEKMAAMGQLAAGIAHEINNPVGFVGSNLSTLDGYLNDIFAIIAAYERAEATCGASQPDCFAEVHRLRRELNFDYVKQDITDLLSESKEGLGRVRKIVLDLKNFSRSGDIDWAWADINEGIESTLNIVWNELKYHCTVNRNYGKLPQICCLPSQLNQVFMNLLVNAGHAIEGRGEITITTECVGDDAVRIRISDTGKGMSPEVQNRIFEPFFTTKPIGKGTGLGLSIAWSIVERHRGRIEVSSEVGKGTSFTITLPIEQEGAGQAAQAGTPA